VCVPTRLGYVDGRIVDSTGSTKLHRGGTLTARLKTGARQCRRLRNDRRAEFFALPDYFAAADPISLQQFDRFRPIQIGLKRRDARGPRTCSTRWSKNVSRSCHLNGNRECTHDLVRLVTDRLLNRGQTRGMRLPFRRRPIAIEARTAFRTDYGGQADLGVRHRFATFYPFDALSACSGQAFHFFATPSSFS
jgi:hypothetical protein